MSFFAGLLSLSVTLAARRSAYDMSMAAADAQSESYRAFEASQTKSVEMKLRRRSQPVGTQVCLRVLACTISAADRMLLQGTARDIVYPRVPGAALVGRIEQIGPGVSGWRPGQVVGCASFGGSCGDCLACRSGDHGRCEHLLIVGVNTDGGLAEEVLLEADALTLMPDQISPTFLACVMDIGTLCFQALRKSNARAGDVVAVQGIGAMGHLALQYANRMGFQPLAISRGKAKQSAALRCGAHAYIDSDAQSVVDILRSVGGAHLILNTAPNACPVDGLLRGLANRGTLVMADRSGENVSFAAENLSARGATIRALPAITPWDVEETLRFSIARRVQPIVRIVKPEQIPAALTAFAYNAHRFSVVVDFTS